MWTCLEASTINTVVVNHLSIHYAHNRILKITLSVFYHPRPLNTMANDGSRRFDLSPHPFFDLFRSKYSPQSPGSWTKCHLLTKVLSLVISVLNKQPYAVATSPTAGPSHSTPNGPPSAPTCSSNTCLRTRYYPLLRSFRCIDTGSIKVNTPTDPSSSGRNPLQQRGVLLPRPTLCMAAAILENPEVPTPRIPTSA